MDIGIVGYCLLFLGGTALGYGLAVLEARRLERRRLDEMLRTRGRLGWKGVIKLPTGNDRPKLPASVRLEADHG